MTLLKRQTMSFCLSPSQPRSSRALVAHVVPVGRFCLSNGDCREVSCDQEKDERATLRSSDAMDISTMTKFVSLVDDINFEDGGEQSSIDKYPRSGFAWHCKLRCRCFKTKNVHVCGLMLRRCAHPMVQRCFAQG